MKFQRLLETLSRVVVVAHKVGGEEGKRAIMDLFTLEEDNVLVPLKRKMRILAGEDTDVPDYTIHHLSGIELETIEFELETDLRFEQDGDDIEIHTQLSKPNPFRSKNHIKIKTKYRVSELAEGIELIRDKLNEQLSTALTPKMKPTE